MGMIRKIISDDDELLYPALNDWWKRAEKYVRSLQITRANERQQLVKFFFTPCVYSRKVKAFSDQTWQRTEVILRLQEFIEI